MKTKFDNQKKIDFFITIIDFWIKTKLTSLTQTVTFGLHRKCTGLSHVQFSAFDGDNVPSSVHVALVVSCRMADAVSLFHANCFVDALT